nr:hypothetical protein [Haliscomenobacter sp.]
MNRLLIFALLLSLLSCKMEDPATPGLLVPKTVDQDPTLPQLAINGTLLQWKPSVKQLTRCWC